jgi:hypothetical protein
MHISGLPIAQPWESLSYALATVWIPRTNTEYPYCCYTVDRAQAGMRWEGEISLKLTANRVNWQVVFYSLQVKDDGI